MKEKLEAAYPYVTFRGGIDDHGNFIMLEHQRVAISPNQDYARLDDLVTALEESVPKTESSAKLNLRLTYEPKRDFHKRVAEMGIDPNSPTYVNQGWPPNHFAEKSFLWEEEHTRSVSATWPPNHKVERSAQQKGIAAGSLAHAGMFVPGTASADVIKATEERDNRAAEQPTSSLVQPL